MASYPEQPGWTGNRMSTHPGFYCSSRWWCGSGDQLELIKLVQITCTQLQWYTSPAHHHSGFLQAECPFCHPTNDVNAVKAISWFKYHTIYVTLSAVDRSANIANSAIHPSGVSKWEVIHVLGTWITAWRPSMVEWGIVCLLDA